MDILFERVHGELDLFSIFLSYLGVSVGLKIVVPFSLRSRRQPFYLTYYSPYGGFILSISFLGSKGVYLLDKSSMCFVLRTSDVRRGTDGL